MRGLSVVEFKLSDEEFWMTIPKVCDVDFYGYGRGACQIGDLDLESGLETITWYIYYAPVSVIVNYDEYSDIHKRLDSLVGKAVDGLVRIRRKKGSIERISTFHWWYLTRFDTFFNKILFNGKVGYRFVVDRIAKEVEG